MKKFFCSCCEKVYPCARTDEEVERERNVLFPDKTEEMAMVCEPCFIKIMDYNEPGMNRYFDFIEREKEGR